MFTVSSFVKLIQRLDIVIKQRSFLRGMTFVVLAYAFLGTPLFAQVFMPGSKAPLKYEVDRRVDNMGYWKRMAELGLVPVAPSRKVPPAQYKSSLITDAMLASPDSPDIPVTEVNSTQSENSVFIHPGNRFSVLNSNNSSANPYPGYFFGANDFFTMDGGESWEGQIQGAGGYNMGDPSAAINSIGRWFVGFIHSGGGQALAYSNDTGATWKVRAIASPPQVTGGLLDKSHLWVDNSPSSPFLNNMYNGWTVIAGPANGKLQVSRSTDKGMAWQMPVTLSDSAHARSHNQGINISTGPNGEVYAVWSIYDAFPADESALGFARSFNGGQTWQPGKRILDSIRGIRIFGAGKEMRVNSFPVMAVDNSNSPWRGKIYVVWANVNYPGVNTGQGIDVYMISSSDSGSTWTQPVRINQDLPGTGKKHFFPWITCDPANGNLAVIFYDDRDTPPEQVETWVATSTDGGANWQDFRVSDIAFTPSPVTGLADNYFGDYLGIAAREGRVYPTWTDNRSGSAMTYVSPFRLGPEPGQPYIAYQSHRYNDTLTGNSNGVTEYGESALLDLTLRNMGDTPDSNVTVTLRSDSPFIRITDSTEYFGTIGAGSSTGKENCFAVQVSDSIPNNTRIIMTVLARDQNDSLFVSHFTLKVRAPELTIADILVNDQQGNGSHALDPMESAEIVIRIHNPTDYPATGVACILQSLQDFVMVTDTVQNLGDMLPGEKRDAVFLVTVDTVLAGTPAFFHSSVNYSEQVLKKDFSMKIGQIVEDWETGDFEKFDWTFGGDNEWKIDTTWNYQGKYCVRSGSIGKNQTSSFEVPGRALTHDSISFYRKVSSEARFDYLNFYIDDLMVGKWAGELDWERVVFPVVPGFHTFKWEYAKDPEISIGLDAAFIDLIDFPSNQYTTAFAGNDAIIYECQDFPCNGIATYQDSLRWTTSGSGVFIAPTEARTRYIPSQADKEAGMVVLVLTVYGSTVNDIAIDSVMVSILPRPTAFAGMDEGVCKGDTIYLANASATNFSDLLWIALGDGKFNDLKTLRPVYAPGPMDQSTGSVKLVFSSYAGSNEACGVATDTLLLTIHSLPEIPLPPQYKRCTGYSALLDATTPGGTSYQWLPEGSGDAELLVDSTGIGAGEKNFTVEVTGNHGCRASKTTRVVFEECDEKVPVGNASFRVFPNPAFEEFFIELYSSSLQKIRYRIYDPEGNLIHDSGEFEIEGQITRECNIPGLAQGTYLLSVTSGNNTAARRVILL